MRSTASPADDVKAESPANGARGRRIGPLHVVGLGVSFLALTVATGWLVASAISFFVQWPAATLPGCPDGTSLYTRTEVHGTVAFGIYHCFSDSDAKDVRAQR
jgi:hypothetical protein